MIDELLTKIQESEVVGKLADSLSQIYGPGRATELVISDLESILEFRYSLSLRHQPDQELLDLHAEIQNLKAVSGAQIDQFQKNVRGWLDDLRTRPAISEETIRAIAAPKALDNLLSCFHSFDAKVSDIHKKLGKEAGKTGERSLADLVRTYFPADIVHDTRSTAHTGDIVMECTDLCNAKILLESKNYTGTIPYPEVEKFQRDCQAQGASWGLFYSFNSPIQNMGRIHLQWNQSGGAYLYIGQGGWEPLLAVSGLYMLKYLIKFLQEQERKFDTDACRSLLDSSMVKISKCVEEVLKMNDQIGSLKRTSHALEGSLQNLLDQLRGVFTEIQNSVEVIDTGKIQKKGTWDQVVSKFETFDLLRKPIWPMLAQSCDIRYTEDQVSWYKDRKVVLTMKLLKKKGTICFEEDGTTMDFSKYKEATVLSYFQRLQTL